MPYRLEEMRSEEIVGQFLPFCEPILHLFHPHSYFWLLEHSLISQYFKNWRMFPHWVKISSRIVLPMEFSSWPLPGKGERENTYGETYFSLHLMILVLFQKHSFRCYLQYTFFIIGIRECMLVPLWPSIDWKSTTFR